MSEAQSKYLVFFNDTGYIVFYTIRKYIDESNITNAAIVFDYNFGEF